MSASPAEHDASRTRRFDPHRKQRILDAALTMIAEHGVAGTTHRRIAAAADVPLGSLTYHFHSLEDLRAQAFTQLAERGTQAYAAHFESVRSREDLIDAVTDLVHASAGADANDWVAAYELYLAALRDPALRSVTESWMQASRRVLERFVDPDTARGLDALIEGLIMHRTLSTAPSTRAQTRAAVARAITPDAAAATASAAVASASDAQGADPQDASPKKPDPKNPDTESAETPN